MNCRRTEQRTKRAEKQTADRMGSLRKPAGWFYETFSCPRERNGAHRLKEPKTIYYRDELTDEFSAGGIKARPIDGSYSYGGTVFRPLLRGIFYHVLAKSVGALWLKLHFGHRVVGREKLKETAGAVFLYGNHTHPVMDALMPTMLQPLKSTYVIVHPDNVSMPVLGALTPALGAVPLPDDKKAYRNFSAYLDRLISGGHPVAIYPEAHIWPFYTGIRPFPATSFHYPVKYGTPVYCFTNTYEKRHFRKTPRVVTYVDGPFYPDPALPRSDRISALREQCFQHMTERAKNSSAELIRYIKEEDQNTSAEGQ